MKALICAAVIVEYVARSTSATSTVEFTGAPRAEATKRVKAATAKDLMTARDDNTRSLAFTTRLLYNADVGFF